MKKWSYRRDLEKTRFTEAIALGAGLGILIGITMHVNSVSGFFDTEEAHAEVVIEEVKQPEIVQIEVEYSIERVNEIYREAAQKYGVSEEQMLTTMRCESHGGVYNIQSHHRYTFSDSSRGIFTGNREKSHGASQIHLPDHPTVTVEEANNPYFAAEFMAKAFASGHASWWTCWRDNYR